MVRVQLKAERLCFLLQHCYHNSELRIPVNPPSSSYDPYVELGFNGSLKEIVMSEESFFAMYKITFKLKETSK